MRIALTGGASGIGAALLETLGAAGHEVTAFDVVKPTGHYSHWIETDLGDADSIEGALAEGLAVAEQQGGFEALINNAGLPPREGQAVRVLAVNFLGFRRFLNGMLDALAPGAAIVNTASRAGAHWRENLEEVTALSELTSLGELESFVATREIDDVRAYSLSKEAMIAMTLGWTEELFQRGLRMNAVSPAAVSTGILGDFSRGFGDRMTRNVARAGRPGSPQEIAEVIAFLISPHSAWLKGVDLTVDGGMSAMAVADALNLPRWAADNERAPES